MTLERFEELLNRFGAELTCWPEAESAAAKRLLDESPEALALFSAQQEVEALLSQSESLEPSARLRRRVAEVPLREPRHSLGWGFWWRPLASVLGCAVVGVALGWLSPSWLLTMDESNQAASSEQLDEPQQEMRQLEELALADELLREWE